LSETGLNNTECVILRYLALFEECTMQGEAFQIITAVQDALRFRPVEARIGLNGGAVSCLPHDFLETDTLGKCRKKLIASF
jgi:hypothetical protein